MRLISKNTFLTERRLGLLWKQEHKKNGNETRTRKLENVPHGKNNDENGTKKENDNINEKTR
jgi:hypothetical protein